MESATPNNVTAEPSPPREGSAAFAELAQTAACKRGARHPNRSRHRRGGQTCDSAARVAPLILLAALALRPLSDVDFWWQHATGRWILQHGISAVEVFTTSRAGTPRIESSWLYCVLLSLLRGAIGVSGLVLLKTAALVCIFGAIGPLRNRVRVGIVGPVALSLAVYASHMRFVVRPELFTMGAFVAFLLLLDNDRISLWRRTPVLVVVQVFWVNTHSVFLLGPAMVACWALEPLITSDPTRRAARSRLGQTGRRLGVLGMVFSACLINPYGSRALTVPGHQLATLAQSDLTGPALAAVGVGLALGLLGVRSARLASAGRPAGRRLALVGVLVGVAAVVALLLSSSHTAGIVRRMTERISTPDGKYILELRSPLDPLVWGSHTMAGAALALLAVLCVVAGPNRPRIHQVVVLAATLALTLLAVRNLALFSLCAAFLIWRSGQTDGRSPEPPSGARRIPLRALQLLLIAVCAVAAWGAQTNRLYAAERWALESGLGVSRDEDYTGVADFLASVGVTTDIFNTHGVGSFLLDRGVRVFVDSRAAAGVLPEVARVVTSDDFAAIDAVTNRYPVRAFVVETQFLGLIGRLAAHPDWRLCYADPNAVVFLSPREAPSLDRLHMDAAWMETMRSVLPPARPPAEAGVFGRLSSPRQHYRLAWVCLMAGAYGHARDLLEDALISAPSGFAYYDALAYANAATARMDRAAELYEIAISREPGRPRLHMDAARAYLGIGALDVAERHARAALGAGPESRFVLGTVFLRQRRDAEAVSMLESAVRDVPNAPLYHSNLATAYLAVGRIEDAAEHLRRAAALDPSDPICRRDVCRVLASLGRYDEAARFLGEAEQLDPDHPDLAELFGLVVLRR